MGKLVYKSKRQQREELGLIQFSPGGIGMGEVKIRVKITNIFDERLVKEGFKSSESIRSVEVDALVDTGAVQCVIPADIADQLGLKHEHRDIAIFADGRRQEVPVTEPARIEIMGRQTHEDFMVVGNEVLIGQTALEKTDLFVDCKAQRLVPNPENPDYPVIRIY